MPNSAETFISLTTEHPYLRLLSYPADDAEQQAQYLQQLQHLGVEYLVAAGSAQLGGLPILGSGYCGIVIAGIWRGHAVAIKVRRSSCKQADLDDEARLLRMANLLHIGPQLYCHQGDLLVMERLNGSTFGSWLHNLRLENDPKLRRMLQNLLWQGFHLDAAGIDHGALRCVAEHVFIADERLTIIDFSHSSDNRHPNNVTSLIAGLLWGTQLSQDMRRVLLLPERDVMLPLLQNYKHQPQRCHFQALLRALGLSEQEPQTVRL